MLGPTARVLVHWLAGLLVVGGLAAMLWSGLVSMRYHSVLDPNAPCLRHGLCDPEVVSRDLWRWWLQLGAAAAAVLVGLALAVAGRPRVVDGAGQRPASRRWDAATGLVAAGVLALGALPLALAGLASTHLGVAALVWMLVSQAWILDWYAAARPPLADRPRLRLAAVSLAATAGLAAATAVVLVVGGGLRYGAEAGLVGSVAGAVLVHGLVVAACALGVSTRVARAGGPAPGPGHDDAPDRSTAGRERADV